MKLVTAPRAAELGRRFRELGRKIAEKNVIEQDAGRDFVHQRHFDAELGIQRFHRLRSQPEADHAGRSRLLQRLAGAVNLIGRRPR